MTWTRRRGGQPNGRPQANTDPEGVLSSQALAGFPVAEYNLHSYTEEDPDGAGAGDWLHSLQGNSKFLLEGRFGQCTSILVTRDCSTWCIFVILLPSLKVTALGFVWSVLSHAMSLIFGKYIVPELKPHEDIMIYYCPQWASKEGMCKKEPETQPGSYYWGHYLASLNFEG